MYGLTYSHCHPKGWFWIWMNTLQGPKNKNEITQGVANLILFFLTSHQSTFTPEISLQDLVRTHCFREASYCFQMNYKWNTELLACYNSTLQTQSVNCVFLVARPQQAHDVPPTYITKPIYSLMCCIVDVHSPLMSVHCFSSTCVVNKTK